MNERIYYEHIVESAMSRYCERCPDTENYIFTITNIAGNNMVITRRAKSKHVRIKIGKLLKLKIPEDEFDSYLLNNLLVGLEYCSDCNKRLVTLGEKLCNKCVPKYRDLFLPVECSICTQKFLGKDTLIPACCDTNEHKYMCRKCMGKTHECPFCRNVEKFREYKSKNYYYHAHHES